ncbi:MAG: TRAP transporter large permease subunit [Sinorhizobium meliloti]|jgi:tripartite ATP-independent transporter DctM subunit|uniref:TRAP transporter large permease n=1 Tax=Sinorhizobium TaxID=28105 RepID=UPI00035EC8DD|nr:MULTISPECIES: TRAP transporter large permease subunit [Sinorhizobium]MCG5482415.1 TRAP transporter large permease subunit [Sinorhizobium meliloti]PND23540.1 C4-dicarboxylate ABC transporter [Ensifer sp. MMN_5]PND28853.1 C4-dicarboxylate ABC transporter [Sinorhizobium sp. M4_45]RVP98985.1 TRAP transporter large permease subunit [Sinorhizobium meliloti]
MSYEMIAFMMFSSMMMTMLTGQRVFAAIGVVGAVSAAFLWGNGGFEMAFAASMKLMKWYPLLTLPLFIFMGYMLSESGIAEDLYKMFHVWMGGLRGGLALGTIGLMVIISAMNGLSVAGMAIGATIALPELLRRGYDKTMVTGVIQAGSSLGILVPPSVVLVLYGMIARQPVGQLWLAGVFPGLLLALLFSIYVVFRCKIQPHLGPALPKEERNVPLAEKLKLLRAGILPFMIFFLMMGLFVMGVTSLVESSAVGALSALVAAWWKGRLTWTVFDKTIEQTLGISCMFMWIILAALCFGAVFDGLGAVKAIEFLFLEKWGLGPWEVLILMQLSYLVMGTFLDDTAMLVIVAPLYIPLVGSLGFDLIWYGVLYTITCQIAYMTPPFGYNLFLMRAMAPPEISLMDIYRSVLPFVLVMLVGLAIVTAFPEIALWLPHHVYVKG